MTSRGVKCNKKYKLYFLLLRGCDKEMKSAVDLENFFVLWEDYVLEWV